MTTHTAKGFQTLSNYFFKQDISMRKVKLYSSLSYFFKSDKKGITLMPKIPKIMKFKALDIDTLAHLTDALILPASYSCVVV